MNNLKTSYRWFVLSVSVIAMLFAGIIYAWSILKVPFSEEFGWTAEQLSLNFTLTMCFFCLGGLLGSFLSKKIGVVGFSSALKPAQKKCRKLLDLTEHLYSHQL